LPSSADTDTDELDDEIGSCFEVVAAVFEAGSAVAATFKLEEDELEEDELEEDDDPDCIISGVPRAASVFSLTELWPSRAARFSSSMAPLMPVLANTDGDTCTGI